MIEIFIATTVFIKSDFKNLRRSDGFIGRMQRSISGCLSSHEGVAGTDNRPPHPVPHTECVAIGSSVCGGGRFIFGLPFFFEDGEDGGG